MTWMIRIVACCLLLAGASGAVGQQEHWSQHMHAHGDKSQFSLADIRATYETQFESDARLRGTGLKQLERWSHWQAMRGGQTQRVPASSWWQESADARAQGPQNDAPTWTYVGPVSETAVPVHGGAGRINKLIPFPGQPDRWLACAPSGGLWQTTDGGQSWSVFGMDALAALGASDAWIDPNDLDHVWLATGDSNGGDTYSIGILETWDGGTTWTPLSLGLSVENQQRLHVLRAHPSEVGRFWVGGDLGLFTTDDGGETFALQSFGSAVRDIAWMSDSIVVLALEGQGLARSADGGASWTFPTLPSDLESVGRIQIAAESWNGSTSRDTLYAVAGHDLQQNFLGFWRSADAGVSWEAMSTKASGPNLLGVAVDGTDNLGQAFWDLCLKVNPNNVEHVLVGGINLWSTMDGGQNWTCELHWQGASSALRTHADQHDLLWLDNGDVVVSNDGGVFRWDDSGVCDLSAGLQITQAYALGMHPSQPGRLVLGSQDNGTSLQTPLQRARVLDGDGFDCFFSGNTTDTLYASAYYGLLYRSADGGRTMTQVANYFGETGSVNEVGAWHTPFQPHPAVPGRIVAAKKSLHHSDDGGESWTSWSGTGEVRCTALALSSSDPEVVLLAKNSTLYARDGAEGFVEVDGLPGLHIGDVSYAQSGANQEWWVAFAGYEGDAKVWRTTDGGTSWINLSAGLPNLPIHCLLELTDGSWMCGSDLGVHLWSEESQIWTMYGAGLPLTPVTDLEEDMTLNRIVAGTYGRGAWTAQLPSAPEWTVVPVALDASPTQCENIISGGVLLHNAGQANVTECALEITLTQGSEQMTIWEGVDFSQPLQPGASVATPDLSFSSPFTGNVELAMQVHAPNGTPTGAPWTSEIWTSGIAETTVLTWWGDCENEDMRWDLTSQDNGSELALASTPLASGDTLVTSWCLPEGCYTLTWNDQGGDGFSGDYCQGAGGFRLQSGSGELHHESEGQDFGDTFSVSFCTGASTCHADYNGDGVRNVEDFLVLLADFGCTNGCMADNSNDGVVNVIDVMNFLTLYSLDCPAD
ncbi:MAG: hypothetical protein ACPHX0_03930 [Flavobacteriales bacterium]